MKLYGLFLEATAAEEAKQRGYNPRPFGYWEKNGKIVARTVDGKLELVSDDEPSQSEPSTEPDPKPTGMSAKDAGTAPSNTVTQKDAKKTAGIPVGDEEDGPESHVDGSESAPQQPIAKPNPHRLKMGNLGMPAELDTLDIYFGGENDEFDLCREILPGEEVIVMTKWEVDEFIYGEDIPFKPTEFRKKSLESADKQHREWRSKLPDDQRSKLFKVQHEWQGKGHYHKNEEYKEKVNSFINSLPPSEVDVFYPIERGMSIDSEKIEDFLKEFRVGEDVTTPPSGFSTDPRAARSFAIPYVRGRVGVLVRVLPNEQGKVNGICLSGLTKENANLSTDEEFDLDGLKAFDYEHEVIRPTGPVGRCVGVKKLIYTNDSFMGSPVNAIYVIDLEERGYESDLHESINDEEPRNHVFEKIMNTSFGDYRPKQLKLSKIASGVFK